MKAKPGSRVRILKSCDHYFKEGDEGVLEYEVQGHWFCVIDDSDSWPYFIGQEGKDFEVLPDYIYVIEEDNGEPYEDNITVPYAVLDNEQEAKEVCESLNHQAKRNQVKYDWHYLPSYRVRTVHHNCLPE